MALDLVDANTQRRLALLEANSVTAGALDARYASGRSGSTTYGGADQAGITTTVDFTGHTVTFTAAAGIYYQLLYGFAVQQITLTGNQNFFANEGATQLGLVHARGAIPAGNIESIVGWFPLGTFTAGSHTVKLRGSTSAGTMTVLNTSNMNARLQVQGIGI